MYVYVFIYIYMFKYIYIYAHGGFCFVCIQYLFMSAHGLAFRVYAIHAYMYYIYVYRVYAGMETIASAGIMGGHLRAPVKPLGHHSTSITGGFMVIGSTLCRQATIN